MRITLPGKSNENLRKWRNALGWASIPLLVVYLISSYLLYAPVLSIVSLLLFLGCFGCFFIWLSITTATPKSITDYTYLDFSDTAVTLGHSTPTQTHTLPYDKTQVSLSFKPEIFDEDSPVSISHITLSFTQEQTYQIELTGYWHMASPFTRQLLDNIRRFQQYDVQVLPDENITTKEQQDRVFFIQEQIQNYLDYKQMVTMTPAARQGLSLRSFAWSYITVLLILFGFPFLFYAPAREKSGLSSVIIGIIAQTLFVGFICWLYRCRCRKENQKAERLAQLHREKEDSEQK